MSKDYSERRLYRKSPGRQYGYDYNPLQKVSLSQSGRIDNASAEERWSSRHETPSRTGSALAQRPDLRRTRQLLRKNIIASKRGATGMEEEEYTEYSAEEQQMMGQRSIPEYEEYEETPRFQKRSFSRSGYIEQPVLPPARELPTETEEWVDYSDVDPDQGYDEYDPAYEEHTDYHSPLPSRASRSTRVPTRSIRPRNQYEEETYADDEYDVDVDEYEEPVRPAPRKKRKKSSMISRRKLLWGAGAVAVGGTAVAVTQFGNKIPEAIGDAGANIEQQLQEAFNKGMQQGADNVRKEFVEVLQNLEGFSLEGAINAAKLTRVAYDVFVSPILQFGSVVSGDVLKGFFKAFQTARGWLAGIYQDNATLIAIQKVLQAWIDQATTMPKKIDAITHADLDGAQSYLRALQRKIEEEQKKLNSPNATPTAAPKTQATPAPKKK